MQSVVLVFSFIILQLNEKLLQIPQLNGKCVCTSKQMQLISTLLFAVHCMYKVMENLEANTNDPS